MSPFEPGLTISPYTVTRNPSYLNSLAMTFRIVFWEAPAALIIVAWFPVITLVAAALFAIAAVLVWAASRVFLLVVGLAGHLTPDESKH